MRSAWSIKGGWVPGTLHGGQEETDKEADHSTEQQVGVLKSTIMWQACCGQISGLHSTLSLKAAFASVEMSPGITSCG